MASTGTGVPEGQSGPGEEDAARPLGSGGSGGNRIATNGRFEPEREPSRKKDEDKRGIIFLLAFFVSLVVIVGAAALLYFGGYVSFATNAWWLVVLAALLSCTKTCFNVVATQKYALHKQASEFCTLALGGSFTAIAAQINASDTALTNHTSPINLFAILGRSSASAIPALPNGAR
jgi:hypothetical protein